MSQVKMRQKVERQIAEEVVKGLLCAGSGRRFLSKYSPVGR